MKKTAGFILIFTGFLLSCRQTSSLNHMERSGFLMDTVIRISLYDSRQLEELEKWADELFLYMLSIEKNVSVYIEGSDPQRLKAMSGSGKYISISHETDLILKEAAGVFEVTEGAFDVTIGPVKTLWGFDSGDYHIPDSSEIASYLERGNFRNLDMLAGKARITEAGLGIDLGGIAKGYILDAAVSWLQKKGIQSGLVEGGGDLRIFGPHPKRDFWRIGIQDPRGERGALIGIVSMKDRSIATSGDYERFFIRNGKRYHHILDPETGFPSQKAVSVTVIAPNALLADAYATAVFVMGPDKGVRLLNNLPDIEGLIVYQGSQGLSYAFSDKAETMIEME